MTRISTGRMKLSSSMINCDFTSSKSASPVAQTSNSRLSRVNEPMISLLEMIFFISSILPKSHRSTAPSAFRHLGKIGHFLLAPRMILGEAMENLTRCFALFSLAPALSLFEVERKNYERN